MKVLEMLTPPVKALVIVLFAHAAFADGNVYWADANNGNDDYTGTAREWAGGATDAQGKEIGPRKSLKAAMALAKSGDTVYALPGEYRDEIMVRADDANITARVIVPDGVKLVSTDGREKTVIRGAAATVPDAKGMGTDAVRCVHLLGSGSIFGFTLADGRTKTDDNGYGFGGGVSAAANGTAVDCFITNCVAKRGGAFYGGKTSSLVNSVVVDCNSASPGSGVYNASVWGCLFMNMAGRPLYSTHARNCSALAGEIAGSSGSSLARTWNSYLMTDGGNNVFSNCYSTLATAATTSDWSDPRNRRQLDLYTQFAFDAKGMPVAGSNAGIDMGDWDDYTNGYPAIAADYMYKDAYGRPRVVHGKLDLGAVECNDYFSLYTKILTTSPYFMLTDLDDAVVATEEANALTVPAGAELTGAWRIPATDTMEETYGLAVSLSGDAVVKVYADDALKLTFKRSRTATYAFVGDHDMRIVCEGTTGGAVISTLRSTAHLPYFVAPAPKGNDGNDGLTADTPRETLAAIAAIATTPGSVIHAAPGVYNKGVSGPYGSLITTNRVIVAAGVGLLGDGGAAVTVIEGQQDPVYAYSTNVIRCCYLAKGAWIRGFTLRGGAAASKDKYGENGGGLCCNGDSAGAAVECVFTNNVAVRGDASSDADLIRCLVDGDGKNPTYGAVYNGRIIDSLLVNKASAYTCDLVLNTTIVGSWLSASGWSSSTPFVYKGDHNRAVNTRAYQVSANLGVFNCNVELDKLSDATSEADGDTRFSVPIAVDANGRPSATDTNTVDRGKNDYYDQYFPVQWVQFKEEKDFAGGQRRIGSSIDIGSGEFDLNDVSFTGLRVSVVEDDESDGWILSVASDPDAAKPCTGFSFAGETVSFSDHPFGWTWTKTVTAYPKSSDIVPIVDKVLYVNPNGGDDGHGGYHPDVPLATITKAMELIPEYGVIHCAAGTYSIANGNVGVYSYHYTKKDAADYDYDQTNVVCFTKDYVTLVADEGPDKTIIEGVLTEGTEAVRGVKMRDHCVTQGFTIRNCSTWKNGQDDSVLYGGGVNNGTAVDCVVSNCWSGNRGGSSANATMVRCFIGLGCRSPRTGYGAGGHAGMYCGCMFLMPTYTSGGTIVNCTYLDCAPLDSSADVRINVYNSLIKANSSGRCNYYNCVICGSVDKKNPDVRYQDGDIDTSVVNANPADYAFDPVTYRPLAGSGLIDAGSNETFVAKYPAAYQDLDWAGGQRIYNGTIDIGAGEFDYRPVFAKELAKRRLVVDTATPTVELGEGDGLSMKDGDALDLRWELILEGACSFKVTVTGEGTATVKVDGETVQPDADGVCSFAGTIGEHAVSIAFAGAGTATVDSFTCPKKGSVILVR